MPSFANSFHRIRRSITRNDNQPIAGDVDNVEWEVRKILGSNKRATAINRLIRSILIRTIDSAHMGVIKANR